jgi:hypothetical protein
VGRLDRFCVDEEARSHSLRVTTDLVIDDGVSNIIREFGHDLEIRFVCCAADSLDAV